MAEVLKNNIYTNNNTDMAGYNNLNSFSSFIPNIYLDPAVVSHSFIFVTKPSLFLYPIKPDGSDVNKTLAYNNMCKDNHFSQYMFSEDNDIRDNTIIKQLSCFEIENDTTNNNSPFMPQYTNLCKGFNPSDLNLDYVQTHQTREGFSILTPTNTTPSEASGQITIPVVETANHDFLHQLDLWIRYIRNITNGIFTANPEMIRLNMLDYTCSVYYFVLGQDCRTIKYWCRYTSCYPVVTQYGALGFQKGSSEDVSLDIPFNYTIKEEMDPRLLEDFNIISLGLVNSVYEDNNYESFMEKTIVDETNGYTSYKAGNNLLSKDYLNNNYAYKVQDDARDPLIFYEVGKTSQTVIGSTSSKYILSFGNDSLDNKPMNTLLGDDSFSYNILKENSED